MTVLLTKPYVQSFLTDILQEKFFHFTSQDDFAYLNRCLEVLNSGDIDIMCCNDIQGERSITDVTNKGMFHQEEFNFQVCSIFVSFVKRVYNISDKTDLRYINGCALIRHFKQSLIMFEIFARASYTEEIITDSQKKAVEEEIMVTKQVA